MITKRAHGIDISKYDLTYDPGKAVEQLDFVVQRASYGIVKDEAFETLYEGVKNTPIRLAYHYLNSSVSVMKQVDRFLEIVEGRDYHGYACDFEEYFNTMTPEFARMAWDFIRNVALSTNKRVLLYVSPDKYKTYIQSSQIRFGLQWDMVDLWIAEWFNVVNPDGEPDLSQLRRTTGWNLWQYQNNKKAGLTFGVGRATVDLNVFNGTVEEMKRWLRIKEPPIDPPHVNPSASVSVKVDGNTYEANDVELRLKKP